MSSNELPVCLMTSAPKVKMKTIHLETSFIYTSPEKQVLLLFARLLSLQCNYIFQKLYHHLSAVICM